VTSDDILEFGLIPELVGRLPITTALAPLGEEGLIKVLTEPMEGSELEFTEKALAKIAGRAMEKETGARGLQVMLDIMYDLPDKPKGSKIVIDEEIVEAGFAPQPFKMPTTKSA